MKKISIKINDQKNEILERLIKTAKKVIRIAIGFLIIVSSILRYFYFSNLTHASYYNDVISKHYPENDRARLAEEFLDYIKKTTDDSFSNEKDSGISYSKNLRLKFEDIFEEIEKYLQEKKINIHSLDIYFLRKSLDDDKKKESSTIFRKQVFFVDLTRSLLVNNLTRLVKFIQSFVSKKIRTQSFLFYSEIIIKMFIFSLLLRFLQIESNSFPSQLNLQNQNEKSNLSNLSKKIFDFFDFAYNIVNSVSWSSCFISMLPPLNIQKIKFWKWIFIIIGSVIVKNLLEEYAEKDVKESEKRKNIFLRENFQYKVILEIIILAFINFSIYSKVSDGIKEVIYIANGMVPALLKVASYWKYKLKNNQVSEKAL